MHKTLRPINSALPRSIESHLPGKDVIPVLLIAPSYQSRKARLHSLNYLAGTLGSESLLDRIASNSKLGVARPGLPFFARILDLSVVPKDFNLPKFLERFGPAIIGVTATSATINDAIRIAKIAKIHIPDALRVVGGYHPTAFPQETLLSNAYQVTALGPGEETMAELAMAVAHYGRKDVIGQLRQVDGIAYKDQHGKIQQNTPRNPLIPLDDLPFPHSVFGQYVFDGYAEEDALGFGSVLAARGCPFSCKYCASEMMHQRKVKFRSAESVLQEIKELVLLGRRLIMFDEETFTIHRELDALLDGLGKIREWRPAFRFAAETRGDKLTPEVIERMARAGLQQMTFGVETGDQDLARIVKNSPNIEMSGITKSMEHARSLGISVGYNLLVGFPGQGWQSILDTARLLTDHTPDRAGVGHLQLFGGTYYERVSSKNGEIRPRHNNGALPDFDTANMVHEEMITAQALLELIIYYQLKMRQQPQAAKEIENNLVESILDELRIITLYDLLIRSKRDSRDPRETRYPRVYKSADPIFKSTVDERTNKDFSMVGLKGSMNDGLCVIESFQKYRRAINLDSSVKRPYIDPFLRNVTFDNAYLLASLPFATLRVLILTLSLVYANTVGEETDKKNLTVTFEDERGAAELVKRELTGKKTSDINTAQQEPSFTNTNIRSGEVVTFLGLPMQYNAETRTLTILTGAPSRP